MKDLSPFAQELVKAGRNAGAPTDADKERIREALHQRLVSPTSPEPSGDPNPAAPAARGASWSLIAGSMVVAGVIAGVLVWGAGSDMSAPAPSPPAAALAGSLVPAPLAPPSPQVPRSDDSRVAPQELPAAEPAASTPSAKAPSETRPKNRLAEEVLLLSRATSALHAGRAQAALSALAEHQRTFPRGHLTVERVAARAQALCQLGRKAEGERELARLSPASPQAARARRACSNE